MKHVMKSLKHNGIYVPPYDLKGFSVKIAGQPIKLTSKSEPMAVAWARRVLSTTIPAPDNVFTKNFMREFLDQLKKENPQARFLTDFTPKYLANIDNPTLNNGGQTLDIDFTEIKAYILDDKAKKEAITKEEKKKQAEERKVKRQEYRRQIRLRRSRRPTPRSRQLDRRTQLPLCRTRRPSAARQMERRPNPRRHHTKPLARRPQTRRLDGQDHLGTQQNVRRQMDRQTHGQSQVRLVQRHRVS